MTLPIFCIGITCVVLSVTGYSLHSNLNATAVPIDSTEVTAHEIVESYVYLLGRALAVRQEQIDLRAPQFEYNVIKYNEAGKADFVNPNLDVAYMEAWFAIDENSAIIIEIPPIKNRYYTVQLMDGWGEVLYNLNERNFPAHPYGKYALTLENTTAAIPSDAIKIPLPERKIKMLARVELQKTTQEAVKLQKQFKAVVIGNPVIEPVVEFSFFTNKQLPDLAVFEFAKELMKTPDSKMQKKDSIRAMCNKVAAYALATETNKEEVRKIIRESAIPQLLNYAINKAGTVKNNWLGVLIGGEYHGNYWTRTSANYVGIWANSTAEVIYFIASKDATGDTLKGGQEYVINFEKDKLPGLNVNGFWSVILVDFPNYRVVDNTLKRYNLNNFSPFKYERDSTLKIYIAPVYHSGWPKENWLPSPQNGKFNLTLRMYVPKANVRTGDWFPAPVEKIKK
ncbi:DUF1214 domain-containing protein [Deminuibacter soli]|uniref:DUF1254 domain-containing protein n=1 Tax=Deminuibacter soli TaxID=2291815 RepID=A0A3E1NG86_9BACT|nr:DUF1214 domain-containing protein [Deminuibacter soli]RFM26897.1 DUF1254 domain-containing protein [Deminuibacter soli]